MNSRPSSCRDGHSFFVRRGFGIARLRIVSLGFLTLMAACAHGLDLEPGITPDAGFNGNTAGAGGSGRQTGTTSGTAGSADTSTTTAGTTSGAGTGGGIGGASTSSGSGAGGMSGRGGSGGAATGSGGSSGAGGTTGPGGRGGSGGATGSGGGGGGNSGAAGAGGRGGQAGTVVGTPCAPAYSISNCLAYAQGQQVSQNGHNYTCADANCRNCAANATCEPGATGCPWGNVWQDNGVCR